MPTAKNLQNSHGERKMTAKIIIFLKNISLQMKKWLFWSDMNFHFSLQIFFGKKMPLRNVEKCVKISHFQWFYANFILWVFLGKRSPLFIVLSLIDISRNHIEKTTLKTKGTKIWNGPNKTLWKQRRGKFKIYPEIENF